MTDKSVPALLSQMERGLVAVPMVATEAVRERCAYGVVEAYEYVLSITPNPFEGEE